MSDGWQHIEISDHGTIVVLRPISDEGRAWFEDNVGEAEPGGIYTCEPRMARGTSFRPRPAICCHGNDEPPPGRGGGCVAFIEGSDGQLVDRPPALHLLRGDGQAQFLLQRARNRATDSV